MLARGRHRLLIFLELKKMNKNKITTYYNNVSEMLTLNIENWEFPSSIFL